MVVVIAIIGLVFAVVVARYRDFDSTSVLKNLAYEVALTVREAQVMTISTSNIGGGGVFQNQGQNSYGINFTANSSSYETFSDLNSNKAYDAPGELVKLNTLTQGASISTINERRAGDPVLYSVAGATVTFVRPHLDTTFVTSSNSNNVIELLVTVRSARGATRTIRILKSGRIQVE
jgi:Tfp pilus assembly protein FimT